MVPAALSWNYSGRPEAVNSETAPVFAPISLISKLSRTDKKWRLLTSTLFPEWETLPTASRVLLAAEVTKVDRTDDQPMD